MDKINIQARAKINLTLDVIGKRPDGYHQLETIMQVIDLHDNIILEQSESGIFVTTDHPSLKGDESNIAYRAAKLLADKYKINKGARIHIQKNIPISAGLAGGSTDAAAVLKGLNQLWGLGIDDDEMVEMGAFLGSDVPFCVKGGTMLAEGRGEVLSDLPQAPDMWLVLAKPPLEVSTASVYKNFNLKAVDKHPDTKAMIKCLENGDFEGIVSNLGNVLESVTLRMYPEVLRLKEMMESCGVMRALMSGSGPTVFGIVRSIDEAQNTAERLRDSWPELFITVTQITGKKRQDFLSRP